MSHTSVIVGVFFFFFPGAWKSETIRGTYRLRSPQVLTRKTMAVFSIGGRGDARRACGVLGTVPVSSGSVGGSPDPPASSRATGGPCVSQALTVNLRKGRQHQFINISCTLHVQVPFLSLSRSVYPVALHFTEHLGQTHLYSHSQVLAGLWAGSESGSQ